MLVGVLALQGDVAEHRRVLGELGVDERPIRRPEELAGIDGVILPGGESTTMSMLLESSGLAEPLGKELAAGLPAFGTCAGMILLARHVSDGRPDQLSYAAIDLSVRRNGYGRQLESFESDIRIRSLGDEPFHAVFIRAPLVQSVGTQVDVLATLAEPDGVTGPSLGSGSSAVVCRQGNVLASAFHPELDGDTRLHELFLTMIGEA